MEENIANNIESKKNSPKKKNNLRAFRNLIIKIIVIIIMGYIIFAVLFGVRRMNDQSMNPGIREGSLLFFYRIDKNYNVGDVILFEQEGKEYILRIVAKEGQKIDINEKNELLVDDHPEEHQTYYETEPQRDSNVQFPYIVQSDKIFVMGDYRLAKDDSRIFGAIPIKNIKGKIIGIFQVRNI